MTIIIRLDQFMVLKTYMKNQYLHFLNPFNKLADRFDLPDTGTG